MSSIFLQQHFEIHHKSLQETAHDIYICLAVFYIHHHSGQLMNFVLQFDPCTNNLDHFELMPISLHLYFHR